MTAFFLALLLLLPGYGAMKELSSSVRVSSEERGECFRSQPSNGGLEFGSTKDGAPCTKPASGMGMVPVFKFTW